MNNLLDKISGYALADETEAVAHLLSELGDVEAAYPSIYAEARASVERLRKEGLGLSVEAFLQEYGLSSKEGVSVMCLAEALLRIPDRKTADKLIDSTFDGANWNDHLGKSSSFFVNASSWGLLLTGKALDYGVSDDGEPEGVFGKLVHGVSEPVVRSSLKAAMKIVASQFVMGEDTKEALKKAKSFEKQGYMFSYDMLGEGARSAAQAERYYASYKKAIEDVAKSAKSGGHLFEMPSVSIKLTALHPRYEMAQNERVMTELLPKVRELVLLAKSKNIAVSIDAEEASRLDIELELYAALFQDEALADYEGLGFVLQAYQKRAIHVIDFLGDLSRKTGKRMPVRLVKGAYWDTEIKMAQVEGLEGYPVFTTKAHSDVAYLACAKKMLDKPEQFYPQFATHNALTIAAVRHMAKGAGGEQPYEFQRLHGMGEKLYESVVDAAPCRIYAPIGEHKDLLAYLIRRLLENGANSSFVHVMMDKNVSIDKVLRDPIAESRKSDASMLKLPKNLYGNHRVNSMGFDTGYRTQLAQLEAGRTQWNADSWKQPRPTSIAALDGMMATAKTAQTAWDKRPVAERRAILENAADAMENASAELMTLLAHEAGKTIGDAIAEVREAVDFLRYYGAKATELFHPQNLDGPTGEQNIYQLQGRGVFVCVSPWNFPFAIFMGQVAAALVAGNGVMAKPAEQTPKIALRAVEMLHEADIPEELLQLVFGDGANVGAALVAHPDVAGVAFTGSTNTARHINRALAAKDGAIVPLIAETGGQNCMMVGSSALLEQAVDDIVYSAFGSAGQRCSALRVLYVHEAIADNLITLIKGAMDELKLGNPYDVSTDIGPVIDQGAYDMLQNHASKLDTADWAQKLHRCHPSKDVPLLFEPRLYEIDDINRLQGEVFGPILHVIRYKGTEEYQVIDKINSTGYGLTFGIHTRIPDFYEKVVEGAHVGNAYINRSMTGAVVGVQPFGGEGLSGTGPKAGGPYYLLRFASEKVISTNTAAIGGNIELLSG